MVSGSLHVVVIVMIIIIVVVVIGDVLVALILVGLHCFMVLCFGYF